MPRGVMRNPKLREALKPGRQKRDATNINVMRSRCDEPKAKPRHAFFMRQEPAFSRRMRDGRGSRGPHGMAQMLPRICRAAVRLDEFVGWAKASDANASDDVPTIRSCIRIKVVG